MTTFAQNPIVEQFNLQLVDRMETVQRYLEKEIVTTSDVFLGQLIETRAKYDAMRNFKRKLDNAERFPLVSDFVYAVRDDVRIAANVPVSNSAIYVIFNLTLSRELEKLLAEFSAKYDFAQREMEKADA